MTTVKSNKSIQNLFNNKRTCVDSGRLFSHHWNSIILLLKYMCFEFISIKLPTMGKSNQKIGKTHNYPSVQKSYLTSCTAIGGRKKNELVRAKPQHWRILISWKRSNKIKMVNIFTFHLYVNSDWMVILFVYSLFYHL